jgi:hypothetical protein
MTTVNAFLSWCSHFWHTMIHHGWPMLEDQFALLIRTLMTNVPLTLFLSAVALIWSCLVFRSVTIGNWRWMPTLLMIVLFIAGMVGIIFVVREI